MELERSPWRLTEKPGSNSTAIIARLTELLALKLVEYHAAGRMRSMSLSYRVWCALALTAACWLSIIVLVLALTG